MTKLQKRMYELSIGIVVVGLIVVAMLQAAS